MIQAMDIGQYFRTLSYDELTDALNKKNNINQFCLETCPGMRMMFGGAGKGYVDILIF